LTTFTDQNSQTATYTYDNMWRIASAVFPDVIPSTTTHGETDFYYPDPNTVERKQRQDAANWIDQYVYFDGLGRTKQTRLVDPEGDDYVDITYDALGRKANESNPHRGNRGQTGRFLIEGGVRLDKSEGVVKRQASWGDV
jgi:hypothetical protein